jgi:hypothetical protein
LSGGELSGGELPLYRFKNPFAFKKTALLK